MRKRVLLREKEYPSTADAVPLPLGRGGTVGAGLSALDGYAPARGPGCVFDNGRPKAAPTGGDKSEQKIKIHFYKTTS